MGCQSRQPATGSRLAGVSGVAARGPPDYDRRSGNADMKVTQPDSRSIRIVSDTGVKVSVPYSFFWNGHDRPAESVVLSGSYEVRAFFLFGEIRDRITEDAAGITLSRTWSVKTPGTVHLCIDLELDPPADLRCLFPGVHSARGLPQAALSFLGEKTTYPSSLFLALGTKGVLVFSPCSACSGTPGSIGVARTEVEDEPPRLHVQMRFPGIEEPAGRIGPKPEDLQPAEEKFIESPGSLERSHDLCLSFAPREEIAFRGPAAVLQRSALRSARAKASAGPVDQGALADALQGALKQHLYQDGGVMGLKETADSPWISASAGLGCALALRKLFPGDARLSETGLRLADFALKGQVPWGFFHESYHILSGRWRGVRGRPDITLLSVGQSARVAELLLALADDLARNGRPYEKYFFAGLRFVDFFLDEKGKLSQPGGLHRPSSSEVQADAEPGIAGLEIFFPVAFVLARRGRDRYKKALDALVRRFSSIAWDAFQPPASREGRTSDAAGAMLAGKLYVAMRSLGYKPVEPPVSSAAVARVKAAEGARLFSSLIVPWIRFHDEPHGGRRVPWQSGCLLDSFSRQRLLCAGHETALLLLQLEALAPDKPGKQLLSSLAHDCLVSARGLPIGTSSIQHTRWDGAGKVEGSRGRPGSSGKGYRPSAIGPVDSRRLVTEVLAGLRISEEFPSR